MRISRLFTDQPLSPGGTVALDTKAGHYLVKVLRLRPDDPVVLFNGDGSDYAGTLVSPERKAVRVAISSRLPAVPEPKLRITLVQAIARGERMDYTLQKCTELGAAVFQPVFTERVEVRLEGDRLARRVAHWASVIRASCEQSGRAVVPELRAPVALQDWLAGQHGLQCFVLDAGADAALAGQTIETPEATLLIGPEGGLTERELNLASLAGARPMRLGPRVLRSETAGPAAVAVLQALGGDF